jgi:hypothetical protein
MRSLALGSAHRRSYATRTACSASICFDAGRSRASMDVKPDTDAFTPLVRDEYLYIDPCTTECDPNVMADPVIRSPTKTLWSPIVNASCVRICPVTEAPAPIEIAPTASILPRTTALGAHENAPLVTDDPNNVDSSERLNAPIQTTAYVPASDRSAICSVAIQWERNRTRLESPIIRGVLFLFK